MRIVIYHITTKIEKVREFQIPDLVNFDVFENIYLLIYSGKNVITVYTLEL